MSDQDAEYTAAMQEARDALYDLLRLTEPGTGVELHAALAHLNRGLARRAFDEEHRAAEPRHRPTSRPSIPRENHERPGWDPPVRPPEKYDRLTWHHTPHPVRARLVLTVIGDGVLSVKEIAAGLKATAGEEYEGVAFSYSVVANELKRMAEAGEVERVQTGWRDRAKSQPLYGWRRRSELTGPIADLERLLNESEDA